MSFIYSSVSQAEEIEEIKIILKHSHFLLAECLQNFLSPTFSQSYVQTPVIPKAPTISSFSVTPSWHTLFSYSSWALCPSSGCLVGNLTSVLPSGHSPLSSTTNLCFFLALVLVNSLTIHPMAEADNLREMWWMGRQQKRIGWDEWRPVAVPPTATFSGISLTFEKTEVLSAFPGFPVTASWSCSQSTGSSLFLTLCTMASLMIPEHRSDVEPLDNSHSAVWLTLPFSPAFPNTISPCILSSHLAPFIFLSK